MILLLPLALAAFAALIGWLIWHGPDVRKSPFRDLTAMGMLEIAFAPPGMALWIGSADVVRVPWGLTAAEYEELGEMMFGDSLTQNPQANHEPPTTRANIRRT